MANFIFPFKPKGETDRKPGNVVAKDDKEFPMQNEALDQLIDQFLKAWNAQDVERVVACYTEDLVYRDPNTRGDLVGADAMRRYLKKLFAAWTMTWETRQAFPLRDAEGGAFLWHATFRKPGGDQMVEADGMDLVLLKEGRIARNEVYFDRVALSALMSG